MPEDMLIRLPEYVSPRIIDRGLDYFRNGFIEPPERVSEHKWVTRAMGRRVYEVSLTFNPGGEDEWHCDCPFDGPVCKHVVASCFAVLQVAGDTYPGVARSGDLYKLPAYEARLAIEQLFEILDKEELIDFLRKKLEQDHQLASVFESDFLYRLPEQQKSERYRCIISREVRSALNNRQFAEYPEYRDFEDMEGMPAELIDPMEWLLDLSKKHRKENRPKESLLICKAILEEVPVSLKILIEDGNDYHEPPDAGGLMESAAQELCKIAESGNEELKNKLFDSLWNMLSNENLHTGDVPDHLLRAMGLSTTDAIRVERYLQLLDRLTDEFRNGKQSFIGEHKVQEIKIGYLQQIGRGKEAAEVMLSLKDDPKFCLMLVRYYIKKKHFAEAKQLSAEGLKKADAGDRMTISLEDDGSRPTTWYKLLYEIAEEENSPADMRTWLEKLIFEGYERMKWFREYKKTWPEAEWPREREKIIAKRKKRKDVSGVDHFLAEIYVEEKLFDRLEEMLKNGASDPYDFNSICLFAPEIADKRPEGAGNVMQQAIEAYAAENVGRKYYRDIANELRAMIKWRGGLRRVRNIVRRLIEEYPTRRAMKEELEQVFSDRVRYM